jgi:hypothetical protein
MDSPILLQIDSKFCSKSSCQSGEMLNFIQLVKATIQHFHRTLRHNNSLSVSFRLELLQQVGKAIFWEQVLLTAVGLLL